MSAFLYGLSWISLRLSFRLLHGLQVRGKENVPRRGPVMIVSNHASFLDPPLLGSSLRRPITFLAWDRLFEIPLLGAFCRGAGAVPTPVEAASKAAFRAVLEALRQGKVVCVFPEGGRTRHPPMDPFKEGAFRIAARAGVPVVPAAVRGSIEVWLRARSLPRPWGRLGVRFGEALPRDLLPSEAARTARERILRLLAGEGGVPSGPRRETAGAGIIAAEEPS